MMLIIDTKSKICRRIKIRPMMIAAIAKSLPFRFGSRMRNSDTIPMISPANGAKGMKKIRLRTKATIARIDYFCSMHPIYFMYLNFCGFLYKDIK